MFSATDVANFLACHHLLTLDRAEARGEIKKPFSHDPGIELLRELGARHEQAYLADLCDSQGLEIVEIPSSIPLEKAVACTLDALRRGVDVIYQGTFQNGPWHGRCDFLIRVQKPSALGSWSYEVVETKLARSTKAGALIQLCFYTELLSQIQKIQPDWMHVVLGGGTNPERYAVQQYIAYFRRIKRDFDAASQSIVSTYPEPTEHCDICSWDPDCDKRRHSDDHLSLVAGITRNQRKALVSQDVSTITRLAQLELSAKSKIDGIGNSALQRIGVLTLPAGGAEPCYESLWSFDRAEEKGTFEKFITKIMERWNRQPDLHIYHYAPYEPTAIKRLAGQHAICIDEIDQLLRAGSFVDLYRVVRQGVRASVESYSIKKMEPLYGFKRAASARDSVVALQTFGATLALGCAHDARVKAELLAAIESYNRDDCLSAWQLRGWLEDRRLEFETKTATTLPRPAKKQSEPSEKLSAQTEKVRAVMTRLLVGVPAEETEWTSEHRASWLLAQMLEYRRREDKSAWWEYFRQCELSDDELLEDRNALGGLTYVGAVGQVKQSTIHRYSFPPQDHTIDRAKAIHDPKTKAGAGTLA